MNTEAKNNLQKLKSTKTVQQFIVLCSYFNHFLCNFYRIVLPPIKNLEKILFTQDEMNMV